MKVSKKSLVIVLCCAIATSQTCATPETDLSERKPSVTAEQKINKYINGNFFGVQDIKKSDNGRIKSLVVVGRASISTSLSRVRAKNQAFRKADAIARAEFMKWLTTSVVYTRIDKESVAIVEKGESHGERGEGKTSEVSESSEFSQEQIVSAAAGFVKGIKQIATGISEEGEAVVILGWSAETAEATDDVRSRNTPSITNSGKDGNKYVPKTISAPRKRASVSDDANDFL